MHHNESVSEPSTDSRTVRGPLLDAATLADLLTTPAGSGPPVLLDVRWSLAGPDRAGFERAHLPGAVFVDLDRDLAGRPGAGGRHPLPEAAALQQVCRAAGIDDGSHVVVYDGGNGLGAARAWWLLRWSGLESVQVLDGGLPAWTADPVRPVERGATAPGRSGTVTVTVGAMPVVDADQAAALAGAPGGVLLDARAAERFRGEVDPVDPVPGHIPGSVNLPIDRLVTAAGTYRPADELAAALHAAGAAGAADTPDVPPVDAAPPDTGPRERATPAAAASCGSGVTACQLVLAGELAGVRLALYPGSYSQWCALGRPVAVGV